MIRSVRSTKSPKVYRTTALGLLFLLAAPACQSATHTRASPPVTSSAEIGQPGAGPEGAATFGLYVLALTWPPSFCCTHGNKGQCKDVGGSFGANHLTLHGLWPNYTDAEAAGKSQTYPTFCGKYSSCNSRNPDASCVPAVDTIPAELATFGPGYVTDNNFLATHEWPKHGSCTGMDSGSYFRAAIDSLKSLPGDRGTPALLGQSVGGTVGLQALKASLGDPSSVLLSCDSSCRLEQVGICLAHDDKNHPTSQVACPQNTLTAPYTNSCVLNKCDTITIQAVGQCSPGRSTHPTRSSMKYLNPDFQKPATWKEMLVDNQRLVQISLTEIEQVLQIARKTPGLQRYEKALHQLSVFFDKAFTFYRANQPEELAGLVALWERYSAAVLQRYTGTMAVELRAADHIVDNIFTRFLSKVPNHNVSYSPDAIPLVYGGEGGLGAYFTHPPGLNRPFAIINLPHSAFANVWQWLALPHEIGHDLYATVQGLDDELETALADRMRQAVKDGEVKIPEVQFDMTPYGIAQKVQYAPEDFLAALWRGWANEAQGDMMGLLSCGGSTIVGLQQIIGFGTAGRWQAELGKDGKIVDEPEPHPVSYVRNALNIAGLRLLDGGHTAFADEIQERFQTLRPTDSHVVFGFGRTKVEFARVEVEQLVKSATLAAEVLLKHPLKVLGDKSYSQIVTFTEDDQRVVDSLVEPLSKGDATFAGGAGVEARHALAATVLAYERDRANAYIINRCFKHFLV